ncbi:MAG: BMP family ABC transporter substrate-binding protein, partial [Candidatus Planktophila sp.]|nr:BMP family ABC transporter substrate-binding protein [Candidatus Planktophila sp.]
MKIRAVVVAIALTFTALIAAPATAASLTIGIAYDIGGRGDRSFNDAAAIGLEKAQKNFTFSVEPVITDGTSADRDRRVRSLIAKNCNPIIVVGSGYAPTIQALAIEYPNTQFAILNDGTIDALNVTSLIFADTQGAYLAGYSAALASKSGKVAMIANTNQADIYQNGFLAGVLASKRAITSMVKYVNGSSVTASKQAMDAGADVLFIARPGSNSEVFASIVARNIAKAKIRNFKAVGLIAIEPDQYVTVTSSTKKYLYATVVKHVDKAIYDVIANA